MADPRRKKVTIIGGGITGLSCAYHLQEESRAKGLPLEITLIEGEGRLGGKIQTHRRDNFIVEAGPDSFITQKPWGVELCKKLGITEGLIRTAEYPKKVFILRNEKLLPLPDGMLMMLPGRALPFLASPIISPLGKLRMCLEIFIPPRRKGGDESLGAFVRRRLGKEALETLAEPLMAGIYVSDPEEMSLAATFPQFLKWEREQGGLMRGMLAGKGSVYTPSSDWSLFISLKGGLSELPKLLSQRLSGVQITMDRKIERIHLRERGAELFSQDQAPVATDALVLTTPAPVTSKLLESEDPGLSKLLSEIRHASTATVSLAFPRKAVSHPLNGFGFVSPRKEGRHLLACTYSSSKFPGRAPGESVLIRGFLGGAKDEGVLEREDDALVNIVLKELQPVLGISSSPLFSEVFRWKKANPQYRVGHLDLVAAIESATAKHTGLYLCGAAYRGVGIPDCIHQGAQTAAKILRDL